MSSHQPKNVRSAIMSGLLGPGLTGSAGTKNAIPPVLQNVGKLAAGVASVNSGSATGNPRNKCALQPGHSLMDWIRLGNSGKDLTGVGPMAGHMMVTANELKKHNSETDAWLAIRGKVFNITYYIPFHPGGVEELMKGAGKDATTLFDQVHPWVNYEQILQKCFIGRLVVSSSPSTATVEEIFATSKPKPNSVKTNSVPEQNETKKVLNPSELNDTQTFSESIVLPRFDWIQKLEEITYIFYTGSYSNPLVQTRFIENSLKINLVYNGKCFENEIISSKELNWPGLVKVNYESGKIELTFHKTSSGIWDSFGILKQSYKISDSASSCKFEYKVTKKIQVASNIFLLTLKKTNGFNTISPIASHYRVFSETQDISRSYTPIPESGSFIDWTKGDENPDEINLMVKRYPDGAMSKYVCDAIKGDFLYLSNCLTSPLMLSQLEKRVLFLMIAAGTGITPMLSLLKFLLGRRIRKSQCIRLLFCNRQLKNVPFIKQFKDLQEFDSRFKLEHILSDSEENWKGFTGHISKNIIEATIEEIVTSTNRPLRDLYIFICGPPQFNKLSLSLLKDLEIENNQIQIFEG